MKQTIYEKISGILENRDLDVVEIRGKNRLKIRGKSAMEPRNLHLREFRTMSELRDYLYTTTIIKIGNRMF